eukprot:CAMPEP_0167781002 /NCGR_PEP_ID=MMETSP0111_2-20121227/5681_1 /TAXON_ID=91324 /ORGANISM="Lotharella globosa, Strain CCCM811" /LENGTH=70 /DNA_ID=CAMNT_0007671597 /DNA_START=180 /DNA_END=389 /DNA_ORIENTATION=-
MSRVMAKAEMRRATKEFATTFAREAAESKPLKQEAINLTSSLAAEFIHQRNGHDRDHSACWAGDLKVRMW